MNSARDFCASQDGKNPLDATGVHPESYKAAKKLLEKLGFSTEDVKKQKTFRHRQKNIGLSEAGRRAWRR